MAIAAGSKVTVNAGSTWYRGQAIPSWVYNYTWIVCEVSGDRAVLDKNTAGNASICSPIKVSYLTEVGASSGSGTTTTTKPSNVATDIEIYRESGRTLLAKWTWSRDNTDHYTVRWWFTTSNGVAQLGEEKDVKITTNCTYTMPNDAVKVWFHVKPVSTTYKVNDTDTSYWTAEWSTAVNWYDVGDLPNAPSTPTVTTEDYKLKINVDGFDNDNGQLENYIEFEIVKDNSSVFKTEKVRALYTHASLECSIETGHSYKVRCRLVQYPGSLKNQSWTVRESKWSEYSSGVETKPSSSEGFTACVATSKTSVRLSWKAVATAKSYDIQYITAESLTEANDEVDSVSNPLYSGYTNSSSVSSLPTSDTAIANAFEASGDKQTVTGIENTTTYVISGLESGHKYYFRLRAVNDTGSSEWSVTESLTLGTKPQAPTTWSSTTTAIVGESLTLYWVHNSADSSSLTKSELEIVSGGATNVYVISNTASEDDENKTNTYPINTNIYSEGAKIQWRVRTAGVTGEFGNWSVQRTIDIYAAPSVTLGVRNTPTTGNIAEVTSFPFYICATTSPSTQKPLGYHLSIVANEPYDTVDSIGNEIMITDGQALYSRYFDISTQLIVSFTPGNVDLANGISYTAICTVTMDSGLTAESRSEFTVSWSESVYAPNAEIAYDPQTYVTYIRPYCEYEYGVPVHNIYLSVYRRDFDGGFTEIATKIDNTRTVNECTVGNIVYVTDPHPSLDYARYRIVATSKLTGAVNYYDVPAYPIGEKAVIIQWDETWTEFNSVGSGKLAVRPWSGSMLRLPYNIDVTDSYGQDVSLVKYIGRKRPVSYYGTQLGETSSWSVTIAKDDRETLYALRRLAIYTGDVYVREPSGSGYWANVTVSFGQKHQDVTIPVTIQLTRVEGGI